MSTSSVETGLLIEQPMGQPIELGVEDSARYEDILNLTADGRGQLPKHLVAAAVQGAHSYNMPEEDLADIILAWSRIAEVIEEEPAAPIINDHGTHGTAIGIADPTNATIWFKHSEILGKQPDQLMIPTTREVSIRRWPELNEGDEEYAGDVNLEAFRPYRTLTSANPQAVDHFLEYRAEWMKYPSSKLIVGSAAVTAYLRAQADRETSDKRIPWFGDRVRFTGGREGFSNSSLLYNLTALKSLDHEVNLDSGLKQEIHETGVRMVAEIITAGLSEGYGGIRHDGETAKILRRLPAAEISMEHVEEVTEQASRLIGAKQADPTNALVAHAQKQGDMDAYLRETTSNFMYHVLGLEEKL